MKRTLPRLTAAAALAAFCAIAFACAAVFVRDSGVSERLAQAAPAVLQPAEAEAQPQIEAAAQYPTGAPTHSKIAPNGNELLRQAADRVGRYASIQAKIRQRADVLGRQLVGSGTYRQLGHGLTTRLRFELRMQATDQVSTLLAVCDGKFFWLHTDYDGQASLERVDLERLKQARESAMESTGQGRGAASGAIGMSLGGLPALLSGLADDFVFDEVRHDSLERLPVTVVQGKWRKERLAEMAPRQRAAILAGQSADLSELPPHAPHVAIVYLGREDLFPYRVEYLRAASPKEPGYDPAKSGPRTIAVMELFEVQANVALPEATFQYQATGRRFVDATEKYLK